MERILSIQELTVSFDGFKALNDLNFSLNRGELRVVIGPNGAGKTTFLDVITGKVKPTRGSVQFRDRNLRNLSEDQISRLGIGRKFQTPRIYQKLTVRQNIELAGNPNKSLFGTLLGKKSPTNQRQVADLLGVVGLEPKADITAELLSHGEKQRLEIGMLVAQSPELLLVDEPVAGLTDEETEEVGQLLLNLSADHSIIVIEHDMEFVRQLSAGLGSQKENRVTVLHEGHVLCEGSMAEVQKDPQVIAVYLGNEEQH
jgi:urea transport system ATP-binding protein